MMVDHSSHIRQLLALALYPPEPVPVSVTQPRPHLPPKRPTTPTEPAPPRSRPHTQSTQTALPASGPAPLSPRKLQEQTEIPSGRASQLAQELLTTLCNTTRPAFLVAGLTSYARPACDADLFDAMVRTGKVDESRSPLVREAVAVGRARDCWTMLRPGFLSRKSAISSRAMDTDEYDDTEGEEEEIVASHAWGVLEWWMRLFEVDQAEHEQEQSSGAYTLVLVIPVQLNPSSFLPCACLNLQWLLQHCFSHTSHPAPRSGIYTARSALHWPLTGAPCPSPRPGMTKPNPSETSPQHTE